MDVVVGVDPSSRKIAMTITVGDVLDMRVKALPQQMPAQACLVAYTYMRKTAKELGEHGQVWVFIEDPVLGRGGAKATIPQTRVNGALLAGALGVSGTKVYGVNNSKAKKMIVGSGNAGKPEIKRWCAKCWPAAFRLADGDQDLIDSSMIHQYGVKLVGIRNHVTELKGN